MTEKTIVCAVSFAKEITIKRVKSWYLRSKTNHDFSFFFPSFFAIRHVDSERRSSDNLFVVLGSSQGLLDHLIEKKLLCYIGASPVIVCARAKKTPPFL